MLILLEGKTPPTLRGVQNLLTVFSRVWSRQFYWVIGHWKLPENSLGTCQSRRHE